MTNQSNPGVRYATTKRRMDGGGEYDMKISDLLATDRRGI